jgi:threonine dehydrogenase-like Zn-dependent dehydrogenase
MRQLTCSAPGEIGWVEVPEPSLQGEGEAIIRPVAVARCEIDPMLVATGPTSDDGFALGHEAVAEVVEVGAEVDSVQPGQLVFCSFQVSCGGCASCRAGHTANCDRYPVLSDYGMQPLSGTEYGGMLSDLVRVPHADAMLVPVPAGVGADRAIRLASVPDNVLDGYRSVAPHLDGQPGADVLVVCHGNRSLALYAVQTALALGAGSVTMASDDEMALEAADGLGARAVASDFGRRIDRWPLVVDCGHTDQGLAYALSSTRPEGTLHSISYYAAPTTPVALGRLYTLGVKLHIGRAHSAALLPEVVALIAAGRLHPEVVTSRVVDWEDAPKQFLDDAIKLVVAR